MGKMKFCSNQRGLYHRSSSHEEGFTLVEVVVSIAVFAILVSLIFANYRYGSGVQNLEQSKQELYESFRFAQSKAITGAGERNCVGGTCSVDLPFGYGVHFVYPVGREVIIFADTKDNAGNPIANMLYDEGFDTVLERRFLKDRVNASSCMKSNPICGQASCTCDIFFKIEDGDVAVNGITGEVESGEIHLVSQTTSKEKIILVHGKTGAIEQ